MASTSVEVILLGASQDGGFPQVGCRCANCRLVYEGVVAADSAVSMALLDYENKQWWLFDASPQLNQQWAKHASKLVDFELAGIFLTHAHAGHYPGILYFGKEGQNSSRVPLFASDSMHQFLSQNEPWRVLYQNQNFHPIKLSNNEKVVLSSNVSVIARIVPHRADFTDTFAFTLCGPSYKLFYCPDVDGWDNMKVTLSELAGQHEFLLLDATFYDDNELPGRDMTKIPHPRVTQTTDIIQCLRYAETETNSKKSGDVTLIHLNHSNRLWRKDPELINSLANIGVAVGIEGMIWYL